MSADGSAGIDLATGGDQLQRVVELEQRLAESEGRFRNLADTAPVMIWMDDANQDNTYFNKAWLDFTGRTLEQELTGWRESVHPEDLDAMAEQYATAFANRLHYRREYRIRGHDGRYRWILDTGSPRIRPDGRFAGYVGVCIDIDDHRRAKEALQQSNEQLWLLIDSLPIVTFTCKPGGDYGAIYISPSVEAVTGYKDEQFMEESSFWADRVHPEDLPRVLANLADFSEPGIREQQYRWRVADGSYRWFEALLRPVFDADGNTRYLAGAWHDIDERKETELELRKAQEQAHALSLRLLAVREEDRARLSHELLDEYGQTLAAISLDLESVRRRLGREQTPVLDKLRRISAAVDRTAEHMRGMSMGLRPTMLDDFGLAAAIESEVDEFRQRTSIQTTLSIDPPDLELDGDASTTIFRMVQETLEVVAHSASAKNVDLQVRRRPRDVLLRVNDDGGAAVQRESPGSALGLAGLAEWAHLVGGRAQIQGADSGGTEVIIELPVPP